MIKRHYFPLFIFLLATSVMLTACDSNDDEDTEVQVEVVETITTTTVDASDPIIEDVNTTVANDFRGIVGDNIVVDNTPAAVIQTTTTSTSSSGAQTTTTTTIAPLVNQTTGQPTGQVAVVAQQGNTTTTVIASANTSNVANVQMSTQASSGDNTTTSLDASFEPTNMTSQSSNAAAWVAARNDIIAQASAGGFSFAARPTGTGETFAQAIQAALASGKRNTIETVLTSFNVSNYTFSGGTLSAAQTACSLRNSGATTAKVTIGSTDFVFTCPISSAVIAYFPPI